MAQRSSTTSAVGTALDARRTRVSVEPRMTTVSKSRYVAGLQCLKRLYLESHAPGLRDPGSANDELLAQAGVEVGALARGRFPGGVHVDGEIAWGEAVAVTARLLTDPAVPAIYEGAF